MEAILKNGNAKLENGVSLPCNIQTTADAKIGLRPEHLVLDPKGKIELIPLLAEPLGANTLIHGKLNGTSYSMTASVPGVFELGQNPDAIRFTFEQDNMHLFNKKDGQRMST